MTDDAYPTVLVKQIRESTNFKKNDSKFISKQYHEVKHETETLHLLGYLTVFKIYRIEILHATERCL
jgi:hypothetical protein